MSKDKNVTAYCPLEKFISDPAIQSPKSTYFLSPTISLCMCLTDLHTTFSQSIESKQDGYNADRQLHHQKKNQCGQESIDQELRAAKRDRKTTI